jgi:hypothetical protein
MSPGDPVDMLERWRDSGATYRILHLSDEAAIVQLCTCFGEPVDRLESRDPGLVAYLRDAGEPDGASPEEG